MSTLSTDGKRAHHHAKKFKDRPRPGLDVNFLTTQTVHVTALMTGAVPVALAPAASLLEAL